MTLLEPLSNLLGSETTIDIDFKLYFCIFCILSVLQTLDCRTYYLSEVDSGLKFKYLTSIVFSHAKGQDVVTRILKALEKLAISLKLMFSLGIDEPNVKKSILN